MSFRADVPIADLRALYAAARVVVIPLRETLMSSGQTVLLECLATGTPVVTSRVSGIEDYLGPGVRAVPPGDPVALREALDEVGGLAPAPERAADFDIARLADRIVQLAAGLTAAT